MAAKKKITGAELVEAVQISDETADAIMEAHGYDVPGIDIRVDLKEQPMRAREPDVGYLVDALAAMSVERDESWREGRDLGEASLGGVLAARRPEPQPVIRSLQLHRRASITGIRGTADLLTVGEVIESIEPQMLGPVAGFVLIAKKAKPIFLPAASVLAVTVE